jgi:hypothetical protein
MRMVLPLLLLTPAKRAELLLLLLLQALKPQARAAS